MADNFNFKQFLVENKLGAYSKEGKLNEAEDPKAEIDPNDPYGTGAMSMGGVFEESKSYGRVISNLGMLEDYLDQLLRNTATNSNIPTEDKQGLLYAFKEMKDIVLEIGSDVEQEDDEEEMTDYMRRRGMNEASNPEGDKLVKRFLTGVAKKFGYGINDAAMFVKETLKRLGY